MDKICNEKQLIMKLSHGDVGAFKEVYHYYSPMLYYKIFKLLKSESISQEVLQEVFLKIWEHRMNIDLEKSMSSYLSSIAANCCFDYFRRINRDKKLILKLSRYPNINYNPIEDALVAKENNEILHKAINSLPQKRRQVFIMCKCHGKSYEEVSRQLGISTSTISDHIVKANLFIRAFLFQYRGKFTFDF